MVMVKAVRSVVLGSTTERSVVVGFASLSATEQRQLRDLLRKLVAADPELSLKAESA